MTYYLWNLLSDTYSKLGQLTTSTATGGAGDGSSIVDSKQADQHKDGDWKRGCLIVLKAGGVAPEGEFKLIDDFARATGTWTPDSNFSAQVESGDRYAWASEYYPLHQMITLINEALEDLGDIPQVNTTTLDTEADKSEYAASVEWKRGRPNRVDVDRNPDDSDHHQWVKYYNWDYVPAGPGSTGLIIFEPPYPPSGRNIRVWYEGTHEEVTAYDDVIYEGVHPARIKLKAAEKAAEWQNQRVQGGDPHVIRTLNDIRGELDRMDQQNEHPIWRPPHEPKLLTIERPGRGYYPGDQSVFDQ